MSNSYQQHLSLAIEAGVKLVEAGAETYRVEDTMLRILAHSKSNNFAAFAYSTGLFASIEDQQTSIRRIHARNLNLSTIDRVNTLSRSFCNDQLDINAAHQSLKSIKPVLYTGKSEVLGILLLMSGFSLLVKGGILDAFLVLINGFFFYLSRHFFLKRNTNPFLLTLVLAFQISFGATLIHHFFPLSNLDALIVASMMPLVPGTAFTNAIRDTLYGDYMSGAARALEALVIASAVAVGVGLGLALYGVLL